MPNLVKNNISDKLINQYKISKIFMDTKDSGYLPIYILHLKNESPYVNPIITFVKGEKKINKASLEALYRNLKISIN